MNITKLTGVIYEQNTFVLEKNGEVIIIDAGARPEEVQSVCDGKNVLAVFLTHGHYDHSIFCNEYAQLFDCPIYADANVKKTMTDAEAMYGENGETINDFSHFIFLSDYERLKQVLVNLLKNSIEAIPESEKGVIEINNKINGEYIEISVKDNGMGMSEQTLAKLKEMFYTTKEFGTGLGVALSNEIVEAHGGTLTYMSSLNEGTTARIRLPR